MKQYKIIAIGLLGELLVACSGESAPYGEIIADEYQITINGSDQHLTFDTERSATVRVNAHSGMSWNAQTDDNWVNLNGDNSYYYGYGSDNLIISIDGDNPREEKRSSTIHLYSDRFNRELDITVEQAGGYINAPENVEFSAMSEEKTINVVSNVSWTLSTAYSSFLESVTPKTGFPGTTTIKLTSKTNTREQDDFENITISPNNIDGKSYVSSQTIQLKREKVTLDYEIDGVIYDIPKSGGSFNLIIKSNSNWNITNLDYWLKPSKRSGSKDETITFTVDANNGIFRFITFCVESGQATRYIWISQEGMPTPSEDDNPTPQYNMKK